jgi:hypothetical protein
MGGVLQELVTAAHTEKPNTTCSSRSGHAWKVTPATGQEGLDDKIRAAKASLFKGKRFEGLAAEHNRASGDLTRADQLSGDSNDEKIWWTCTTCGLEREGDQLHDSPTGVPAVVEVKAKTKLKTKDARQLGRNCSAVLGGAAGGVTYKVPQGPQYSRAVGYIRRIGATFGIVIKIVRV